MANYLRDKKKQNVPCQDVHNVTIWGNHSSTQFPDITHATVQGKPALQALQDDSWVNNEFIKVSWKVQSAVTV